MPTEVLVMCARCRRPQPARRGPCVVCGDPLPDAPMPGGSPPEAPFFLLEGRSGRSISGVGDALLYRAGRRAAPVTLELARIDTVRLQRRSNMYFLPLAAANLVVLYWVRPSLLWLGVLVLCLGLPIYVLNNCRLVVRTREGQELRWFLDALWPGSRRWRALDEAWSKATQSLASRGISAQGPER